MLPLVDVIISHHLQRRHLASNSEETCTRLKLIFWRVLKEKLPVWFLTMNRTNLYLNIWQMYLKYFPTLEKKKKQLSNPAPSSLCFSASTRCTLHKQLSCLQGKVQPACQSRALAAVQQRGSWHQCRRASLNAKHFHDGIICACTCHTRGCVSAHPGKLKAKQT